MSVACLLMVGNGNIEKEVEWGIFENDNNDVCVVVDDKSGESLLYTISYILLVTFFCLTDGWHIFFFLIFQEISKKYCNNEDDNV